MNFEKDIYESIKPHTSNNPQDLEGIIHFIDYKQKAIILFEELNSGLLKLISTGKISCINSKMFYKNENGVVESKFTEITKKDYKEALVSYRKNFR